MSINPEHINEHIHRHIQSWNISPKIRRDFIVILPRRAKPKRSGKHHTDFRDTPGTISATATIADTTATHARIAIVTASTETVTAALEIAIVTVTTDITIVKATSEIAIVTATVEIAMIIAATEIS